MIEDKMRRNAVGLRTNETAKFRGPSRALSMAAAANCVEDRCALQTCDNEFDVSNLNVTRIVNDLFAPDPKADFAGDLDDDLARRNRELLLPSYRLEGPFIIG
jgi:hypothetical protein